MMTNTKFQKRYEGRMLKNGAQVSYINRYDDGRVDVVVRHRGKLHTRSYTDVQSASEALKRQVAPQFNPRTGKMQ